MLISAAKPCGYTGNSRHIEEGSVKRERKTKQTVSIVVTSLGFRLDCSRKGVGTGRGKLRHIQHKLHPGREDVPIVENVRRRGVDVCVLLQGLLGVLDDPVARVQEQMGMVEGERREPGLLLDPVGKKIKLVGF